MRKHQHQIDVDVPCGDESSPQEAAPPLDDSSRGTFADSTTAAANNESLFAAAASVGAIDESSIAPTSSCCDDSSQQEGSLPPIDESSIGAATIMTTVVANNDSLFATTGSCVGANDDSSFAPTSPSVDESSPLGGSSPTQDESSREPVVIKLTTAAATDDSSIAAATVECAADKLSAAINNDNNSNEKILCTEKILKKNSAKKSEILENTPTCTGRNDLLEKSIVDLPKNHSVLPHSSASNKNLLDLPIPRKTRLKKNKFHNTKFSTPLYNVYPDDVVNPIFTDWKIIPKKDVVDDLPPECEIQKGILFINKNIFIFTPVTETDVANILSAHMRNLKNPGSRSNQKKTFSFMFTWMSMLSDERNQQITRSKIIDFFNSQLDIQSTSFFNIDSYDEFLQIVQVLTFMMRYNMPLIRTKEPKKKTIWLQDLSTSERNFITDIMPHTEYEFTDTSFLHLILMEDEPEPSSEKSLADDVFDVIPMISIKYTCPEIFDKLKNTSSTLMKKYMRNAAAHVLIMELDNKYKEIVTFVLKQKATAVDSEHNHQKKKSTSVESYTQRLTAFIKSTIYYNPVWDFGFQLRLIKNSSRGKHAKSLVNLIPNLFVCPCSGLYCNFHQYHNIRVTYQCKKEFFYNSKQFVTHLKRFCDICPYHAVMLDIISFLYPAELSNAVSNNLNLRQNYSSKKPSSRDFKINR